MLGKIWTVSAFLHGAIGESKDFYFTAPFDCSLYHVSACNLAGGTVSLQIKDDGVAITDDVAVGEGSTPAEMDLDDMASDTYPHIAKGSVIHFDIDDTDGDDICIVATFLVG
jgi:hypothetical protein